MRFILGKRFSYLDLSGAMVAGALFSHSHFIIGGVVVVAGAFGVSWLEREFGVK